MALITITWRIADNNACPICKAINGYTWVFDTQAEGVPDDLIHPEYGVVWTKTAGSAAHEQPGTFGHCRCSWTSNIEFGDLLARVQRLHALIKQSVESPNLEVT